jgi:hypothetical protein
MMVMMVLEALESILATGGDNGHLMLWRQNRAYRPKPTNDGHYALKMGLNDDEGDVEEWLPLAHLKLNPSSSSIAGMAVDVNDLAWHPGGLPYLAVAASDNACHVVHLAVSPSRGATLKVVKSVRDFGHYCQGVGWDPWGHFLAIASCDRSIRILLVDLSPEDANHRDDEGGTTAKDGGGELVKNDDNLKGKHGKRRVRVPLTQTISRLKGVAEDDSIVTFVRRLGFSTDGGLLFLPALVDEELGRGLGILARNQLHCPPVFIPLTELALECSREKEVQDSSSRQAKGGHDENQRPTKDNIMPPKGEEEGRSHQRRPIIGFRAHPLLFSSDDGDGGYRTIVAAYSRDVVYLLDSRQLPTPLMTVRNLHFGSLTDVAWDPTGRWLLVASTDGFCSALHVDWVADLGSLPLTVVEQRQVLDACRSLAQEAWIARPTPPARRRQTPKQNQNSIEEESLEDAVNKSDIIRSDTIKSEPMSELVTASSSHMNSDLLLSKLNIHSHHHGESVDIDDENVDIDDDDLNGPEMIEYNVDDERDDPFIDNGPEAMTRGPSSNKVNVLPVKRLKLDTRFS